jgi:hypothetical protein
VPTTWPAGSTASRSAPGRWVRSGGPRSGRGATRWKRPCRLRWSSWPSRG